MNEELENDIERLKKKISDYLRIAPIVGASQKDKEIQIDIMLKDLSELLKKRKK